MPLGIPPMVPSSYDEACRVSVIVPVRNEAAIIDAFLDHLHSRVGDAGLYRSAGRSGRRQQLRAVIRTSPRRWQRNGPWRTTAIYGAILILYGLGVSNERLHRLYRRLR